ncbi:MAG: BTAD domain-containing putative transcriptional regulator [Gemmatimonadota bacterium]
MPELTTLGSVGLRADGILLSGRVTQRRRLALLTLLATAGEAGRTRDKLLAFLWPERDSAGARHALSQSLYSIRQELGQDAIRFGVDMVALDHRLVRSDVAQLQQAIAARDDERIAALYTGPFLDGFFLSDVPAFESWQEEQRRRLADEHEHALQRLARAAAAAGDHYSAADLWARRAVLDPLNTAVALELAHARAAAGDRAGALRHLSIHAMLYREEIGSEPDPALREFADSLRLQPARKVAATAPAAPPTPAEPAEPAEPAGREPPAPGLSASEPREAQPVRVPARRRRGILRPILAAAAMILITAAAVMIAARRSAAEPAGDSIQHLLLGDLEGSDRGLVLAVREALRAELSADRGIRLMTDAAIDESLALMRHGDRPVVGDIALQVAQRHGVPLIVTGNATPLGAGIQLLLQLRDARTGEVIATLAELPAAEADVIPAIQRVAQRLRELVAGTNRLAAGPLPAVTTTSLPALRSYSLARQALYQLDRHAAVLYGEAALVHDSTFALAHYLLADVLWFIDEQRHSDEHMERAYQLSAQLPPRERLIVRARYEQLIRDEPDSAIAYWRLLAASHPDESLAYEGMRWGYRALAQWERMAEASDSAVRRDSTWLPNSFSDRIFVQALAGDSAGLFVVARSHASRVPGAVGIAQYTWAVTRRDWPAAARYAHRVYLQHFVAAAAGDRDRARVLIDQVIEQGSLQERLRAMILQARLELEPGGSQDYARDLLREALEGTRTADLSPPAYARLAERIAEAAARADAPDIIRDARELIVRQDRGRGLRSYAAALDGIDAAAAFQAGNHAQAARLAAASRGTMYYARSVGTLVLLEADARAASGQGALADSLREGFRGPPTYADGDDETYAYLQRVSRLRTATTN